MILIDNKGQVSAEYLLLFVVILLILSAVTIPLVSDSIDASNDVSWASDARSAVNSIASAVDIVYSNGPGAKRTLNVYIPETMNFKTDSKTISLSVVLSDGTTKQVNATTQYPMSTNDIDLNKGWRNVTVKWNNGESSIQVTV